MSENKPHAISSPAFRRITNGFRDGAARHAMDKELEHHTDYQMGYVDGQQAYRAYSRKLCNRMGLIDPVIKPQNHHE